MSVPKIVFWRHTQTVSLAKIPVRDLKRIGGQKLLLGYFVAVLTVYGVIAFRARTDVASGFPDFATFYTAARITNERRSAALYDEREQRRAQAEFSAPALASRRDILPYIHPPFEVLLFLPLALFSYPVAYFIWLATNLALLLSLPFLLRSHLPHLAEIPMTYWHLGLLSFFPIFMALLQGQDSIVILFSFSMAFAALSGRRGRVAGMWLALGLCKFQLVLPFMLPLLWLRQKRIVHGFTLVACVLLIAGLMVAGLHGTLAYPRFASYVDHDPRYHGYNLPQITTNLRGFLSSLLPVGPWISVSLAAATLVILFVAAKVWKRARNGVAPHSAFAVGLLGASLLSYYGHIYDWSILALAVLLILENRSASSTDGMASLAKSPLGMALGFLCFSPLYIIVFIREVRLLWLLTIVPLTLFFLFSRAALRCPDAAESRLTSEST